jgi:uncharacterized protein YjdB
MSRTVGVLVVVAATALLAIACGNSSTSATTIASLAVTGTAPKVGASAQFSAIATMGDGSTQDVSSLATWQSSNAAVATVSSTGVVTGVGAGSVTVNAVYQTVSASDAIVLTP